MAKWQKSIIKLRLFLIFENIVKFLLTLSNREIYMIGHGNLEKGNKSIVQKMWHIEENWKKPKPLWPPHTCWPKNTRCDHICLHVHGKNKWGRKYTNKIVVMYNVILISLRKLKLTNRLILYVSILNIGVQCIMFSYQ